MDSTNIKYNRYISNYQEELLHSREYQKTSRRLDSYINIDEEGEYNIPA